MPLLEELHTANQLSMADLHSIATLRKSGRPCREIVRGRMSHPEFQNQAHSYLDARRDDDAATFVPRWIWSLSWVMLVGLAIVTIEVTSNPALGTFIVCTKWAWKDFLTAIWVRRCDPRKGRGRAVMWFGLAYGMCKVFVWSLLLALAYIILCGLVEALLVPLLAAAGFGAVGQNLIFDPGEQIMRTIWGAGVAFPGLVGVGLVACLAAKRNGTKVWIDSSFDRARRAGSWPPSCDGIRNYADLALVVASGGLVLAVAEAIGLATLIWEPLMVWIASPILIVGASVTAYRVGAGVVARSPRECWSENADGGAVSE